MRFLLLLLLALPARAEKKDEALAPDDFVEQFMRVPTEDLDPGNIEDFLSIDPKELKPANQKAYKARRLELMTLKHLNAGRKKGLIRIPNRNCEMPEEAKSDDPEPIKRAGYMEINEDEKDYLQKKTKCSERELMCESSFQIVVIRDAQTNKIKKRRYFIYPNDPLSAIVAGYRQGKNVGGNTNFFGKPTMLCSR